MSMSCKRFAQAMGTSDFEIPFNVYKCFTKWWRSGEPGVVSMVIIHINSTYRPRYSQA